MGIYQTAKIDSDKQINGWTDKQFYIKVISKSKTGIENETLEKNSKNGISNSEVGDWVGVFKIPAVRKKEVESDFNSREELYQHSS